MDLKPQHEYQLVLTGDIFGVQVMTPVCSGHDTYDEACDCYAHVSNLLNDLTADLQKSGLTNAKIFVMHRMTEALELSPSPKGRA